MAFASDKGRQGAAGQGGAVASGYDIDNSLRLNDDDSAYLSRTPTTAGNRKTWTFSAWVKRGNLGVNQSLITTIGYSQSGWFNFKFTSNDTLLIALWSGTGLETTAKFRDTSAWYHVVLSLDTTNATATERAKLYINGSRVTDLSTNGSVFALNTDYGINDSVHHNICAGESEAGLLDGYISEVNFIDGAAKLPTDFGEFDATYGHWKPIAYAGTYGTNGFYLDFEASGTGTTGAGKDVSGEGNHWSTSGITADDQMQDSPTNNFATLNPLSPLTGSPLSEGNLFVNQNAYSSGGNAPRRSTIGMPSNKGKYYWEVYCQYQGTGSGFAPGIHGHNKDGDVWSDNQIFYYGYTGQIRRDGTYYSYSSSYAVGTIIGIALDCDNSKITWYKNGVSQGQVDLNITADTGYWYATSMNPSGSGQNDVHFNFGQDSSFAGNKTAQGNTDSNDIGDFFYTPPTGYLALCTKNLPDVADGLWADGNNQAFNTVLVPAPVDTSLHTYDTGLADANLIWLKARNVGYSHAIFDELRGANYLASDSTAAEGDASSWFANNGDGTFDLATGTTITHVAWNWKAGGTAVTNTTGDIDSQVSANPTAGFSIVSYTGNDTNGATVGHGLTTTPELVIFKSRTSADNWVVMEGTARNGASLNLTNTFATNSLFPTFDATKMIHTTYGGTNSSSKNYIAYCFHSVDGYSKVGSYTGNGSSDGTFVHTGFKPAYVMVKSSTTSYDWIVWDGKRNAYNVTDAKLSPNTSGAEFASASAIGVDFTSNGFKLKGTDAAVNWNGTTYIFIAFAEHPFKYSTAN